MSIVIPGLDEALRALVAAGNGVVRLHVPAVDGERTEYVLSLVDGKASFQTTTTTQL